MSKHAIGSTACPMSDGDLERKFREFAEAVLQQARTDALIEKCWRLADLAGCRRAGANERSGLRTDGWPIPPRSRCGLSVHGNRSSEEFLRLLEVARIECVVDVRAYPESRRHPHFSRTVLEATLAAAGIGYVWEGAALGGMRRPPRGRRIPRSRRPCVDLPTICRLSAFNTQSSA
jgi:hypothetical protein